ncbi:MAG: hypothetical protein K2H07_03000 [Lachnospiraceae bacterium]|nr:hypothetical protein [Lachnospiraceae bacterium]
MEKHEKGEYGYLKYYRLCKLIGVIVFTAMIEFIVITMLLLWGSTSRVIVVFAILLSLPLAKFFIAFIMCVKFKSLDEEDYVSIRDGIKNEHGIILYDVAVSRYEGMKFYQSICVKNGKICALAMDKSFEENKKDYEKWLESCVSNSKYSYSIYVFPDVKAYIKKADSISEANDRNRSIDKHIAKIILEMSI